MSNTMRDKILKWRYRNKIKYSDIARESGLTRKEASQQLADNKISAVLFAAIRKLGFKDE